MCALDPSGNPEVPVDRRRHGMKARETRVFSREAPTTTEARTVQKGTLPRMDNLTDNRGGRAGAHRPASGGSWAGKPALPASVAVLAVPSMK